VQYRLTRKDFDKLIRDLILRTFKVCDEALQQASLTTRDLNGVILVGGPTRLPRFATRCADYFQREPETDINPDEVVAMGAAIHARRSRARGGQLSARRHAAHLRHGHRGRTSEPIIERNSPVPIDHMRVFTTVRDHQQTIAVAHLPGRIASGRGQHAARRVRFSGFAPGPRGEGRSRSRSRSAPKAS